MANYKHSLKGQDWQRLKGLLCHGYFWTLIQKEVS